MQDPVSLNVEGVRQLIASGLNKTRAGLVDPEEGVSSDRFDEFTLNLDDAELLSLAKKWEQKYASYEEQLKKRQDANKIYYLGKQKGNAPDSTDGLPIAANRNRMIQLTVELLRDPGRLRLQGTREDWQELADHFENIYRERITVKESKDKDDRTLYGDEYVWKRNGPDHFVHTLVYLMVGLDKYAEAMAKVVAPSFLDEIPTGRFFE